MLGRSIKDNWISRLEVLRESKYQGRCESKSINPTWVLTSEHACLTNNRFFVALAGTMVGSRNLSTLLHQKAKSERKYCCPDCYKVCSYCWILYQNIVHRFCYKHFPRIFVVVFKILVEAKAHFPLWPGNFVVSQGCVCDKTSGHVLGEELSEFTRVVR